MASVFKRRGRSRWTIKYFDHQGRRREKASGTTDKRAAERIANELEAQEALLREGVVDPLLAGLPRRFFVNACYWGLRLEGKILPDSSVDIVGEFEPTAFGFDKFQRGKRARDF